MLGRYLDKSDKSVKQTQTAISEGWLGKERKRCSGNKDVPHWTTYNDMANIVWITESSLACGANTASASVLALVALEVGAVATNADTPGIVIKSRATSDTIWRHNLD